MDTLELKVFPTSNPPFSVLWVANDPAFIWLEIISLTLSSSLLYYQLNARTATCTYPTNAIPNSCDNCGFACNSGYKVCGTSCVTNSTTCVSGVAKRNFAELGKKICPQGRQACATTFLGGHNSNGWECVATETDIESCGGCQWVIWSWFWVWGTKQWDSRFGSFVTDMSPFLVVVYQIPSSRWSYRQRLYSNQRSFHRRLRQESMRHL